MNWLIDKSLEMKKILLAFTAISVLIYLGYLGMQSHSSSGPFFMFIGVCTSIGFVLDITNIVRQWVRKNNLRKLGIQK